MIYKTWFNDLGTPSNKDDNEDRAVRSYQDIVIMDHKGPYFSNIMLPDKGNVLWTVDNNTLEKVPCHFCEVVNVSNTRVIPGELQIQKGKDQLRRSAQQSMRVRPLGKEMKFHVFVQDVAKVIGWIEK